MMCNESSFSSVLTHHLICFIDKDYLIFTTNEELTSPSQVEKVSPDTEDIEGIITPEGDINWECPCLNGMADGPCGETFKTAFSCFFYSEADPKGSDCIEQFKLFSQCTVESSDSNDIKADNDIKAVP